MRLLCPSSVIQKVSPLGFGVLQGTSPNANRLEVALRESEEKYRTILHNIEEGYYEVDLTGNLIFFNDSLCKVIGYSKEELMGMNNRQLMTDEMARRVYQIFNEVYRTGITSQSVRLGINQKGRYQEVH